MVELLKKEFKQGTFIVYDSFPKELNPVVCDQVHGNNVHLIQEGENNIPCTDGLIVTNNKIPTAIKTADCLPILVLGEKGYALLHAGWRGIASQIACSALLNEIVPKYFYIGPHIQAHSFEVSEDFKSNFPGSPFFIQKENQLFFNLAAQCKKDILTFCPHAQIEIEPLCTFADHKFHSFRRTKTNERNWNVFIPN